MRSQTEPCKHVLQAVMIQDDPRDEPYPVVVCPRCMRRWFGHEDKGQTALVDSVFPAALRDALLVGSDAKAVEILRHEGWVKDEYESPPNAMISISVGGQLVPTGGAVQITARPQRPFQPSHLVVSAEDAPYYDINDVRIGNHSMFLQAGTIPAAPLGMRIDTPPTLRFAPAQTLEDGEFRITVEGARGLPSECGAFQWDPVQTGMEIVLVVTNTSEQPQAFRAWVMGRRIDPPAALDRDALLQLVDRLRAPIADPEAPDGVPGGEAAAILPGGAGDG